MLNKLRTTISNFFTQRVENTAEIVTVDDNIAQPQYEEQDVF